MPRFIAVPVGQGDAFYLEREDFSVLIDGGRSQRAFPSMFQINTKRDGTDVIACTHNDSDHANGILGFLKAGLICKEVWLPGRWLSILPDVLRPFVEVFDELANDIVKTDTLTNVEGPQFSPSPIETYAERLHHDHTESSAAEEGPSVAEDGWPESYLQMLEQAEPWVVSSLWPGPCYPEDWPFRQYRYYRQLGPAGVQLLLSAIDAADRIRSIATEAFHRGITVRWFEFCTTSPSGGVSELQPINSRKIMRVRPRIGSLLEWLALTVSNKESLVFWSPPNQHHPGVLFNADSDLDNVVLPPELDRAIVTTPHHGSEANANAYRVVEEATNGSSSVTWVRSDGRYYGRPGSSYLSLASRRLCTICRRSNGSSTVKQKVHLYSRNGAWTRHGSSQVCSCQYP